MSFWNKGEKTTSVKRPKAGKSKETPFSAFGRAEKIKKRKKKRQQTIKDIFNE